MNRRRCLLASAGAAETIVNDFKKLTLVALAQLECPPLAKIPPPPPFFKGGERGDLWREYRAYIDDFILTLTVIRSNQDFRRVTENIF